MVVGLIAALALTRAMRALLFEVTPGDPISFAISLGLLAGVAVLASYIPARRATKIDPLAALPSRCLLRFSVSRRSFGVVGVMAAHRYFRCFRGRLFFRSCSASQCSSALATAECGRTLPITRDGNPTFLR